MKNKTLVTPPRECVCCQRAAGRGNRNDVAKGRAALVAVSMTIYGLTPDGKVQKAVPKINICATCIRKATAPARVMESREALRLLAAVKQRIAHGYSLVFGDQAA